MKYLHDQLVKPIATKKTRGAWYRDWHLVSIDGTTLDIADTKENEAYFNRPHGKSGRGGIPAAPVGVSGGERRPCIVWESNRQLSNGREHVGRPGH